MMPVPQIQVDDTRLKKRIADLMARSHDATPAFEEIGEMLLASIERNFANEGRYSEPGSWRGGSKTWDDLAASTIASRAKSGHWPGRILQVSGQLAASMSSRADSTGVTVGTNKVYAGIQNFGGQAGRGHKVTIPARPFVVVQDEDIDEAFDIIAAHLTKGAK